MKFMILKAKVLKAVWLELKLDLGKESYHLNYTIC